jgi:hypothetical protein
MQNQIRVVAAPHALVDSTCKWASGLPSRIQDGSIGDGLRSTLQWPVSISASGIDDLHGLNKDARLQNSPGGASSDCYSSREPHNQIIAKGKKKPLSQ